MFILVIIYLGLAVIHGVSIPETPIMGVRCTVVIVVSERVIWLGPPIAEIDAPFPVPDRVIPGGARDTIAHISCFPLGVIRKADVLRQYGPTGSM